ncbi:MAG: hypothetical protein ACREEM_46355 [Blastocatellia bacterium]
MAITITLPDILATKLQTEAQARDRSAEEFAVELLDQALTAEPKETEHFPLTLEEVVAKIKSLPPNPNAYRLPTGSLADYLEKSLAAEAEDDEEFDLEAWQREWDAVEEEMKAITRANDIAEGRG